MVLVVQHFFFDCCVLTVALELRTTMSEKVINLLDDCKKSGKKRVKRKAMKINVRLLIQKKRGRGGKRTYFDEPQN